MESLNALIQGMGLMHLGGRPGGDAAGQPAAAVAGDCEKVRAVTAAADWLRRPALQYPGGRAGAERAGKPAGPPRPGPAGGDCREAQLRAGRPRHQGGAGLALPSVQGQMETLAVDMGYSSGVLAIFYKVAIGSGIAPLVIFMGVGAMTDFGPLLANPRTLLLGAAAQFGIFATVLGALTLNYFGFIPSPCRRRRPSASSAAPTARRRSTCRASWRRSCWGPSRWPPTPIWRWCR